MLIKKWFMDIDPETGELESYSQSFEFNGNLDQAKAFADDLVKEAEKEEPMEETFSVWRDDFFTNHESCRHRSIGCSTGTHLVQIYH